MLKPELLYKIADASPAGITTVDKNGRITYANLHACGILNLKKEKITRCFYGSPEWEITDFEGKPFPAEKLPFRQVFKTGKPVYNVRHTIVRPDGLRLFLKVNSSPLLSDTDDFEGAVNIMEDITERIAEKEKNRIYSLSMNQINDLVTVTDMNGYITYVNDANCRVLGKTREDLLGRHISVLGEDPDTGPTQNKILESVLKKGFWRGEVTNRTAERKKIILDSRIQKIMDTRGNSIALCGISTDITEQKKTQFERENHLKELNLINDIIIKTSRMEKVDEICGYIADKIHTVIDNSIIFVSVYDKSVDAIKIVSTAGINNFVNTIINYAGLDPRDLMFKKEEMGENRKLFISGKLEQLPGGTYQICEGKIPETICNKLEKIFRVKNVYTVGFTLGNIPYGGITIFLPEKSSVKYRYALETIARNTSLLIHRLKSEKSLKESEKHFRTLFENMSSGVAVYEAVDDGKDFVFTDINAAGEKLSRVKLEDIKGRRVTDLFPAIKDTGLLDCFQKAYKSGKPQHLPPTLYRDSRINEWVENRIFKLPSNKIVAIYEDRTEQYNLEARLHQAEKMEAIGNLAGGIAHDFNNILAGIIGYADMSIDETQEGGILEENLKNILKAGDRAKNLVKQILTFSRQSTNKKEPQYLRPVIKEAAQLLRAGLPSSVDIKTEIAKENRPTIAEAVRIHEIIMNLCTNASHAIEDEGVLELLYEETVLEENMHGRCGISKAGHYSVITVKDNGCGINENIISRIFDPFYTTKETSRGTGLGLSVVFGIVQDHNGNIIVKSKPGEGTVFKVYLPQTGEDVNSANRSKETIAGGSERILFVDDEASIRKFVKTILSKLGYRVTLFGESTSALEAFRKSPDAFDLVITDQTMPRLSGLELCRNIRGFKNDIPVIICSGYSRHIDKESAAAKNISGYLSKPFKQKELAEEVRRVIDSRYTAL